jgi:PucR family transcriptional regulator, purine catabolism regulatory protein
VDLPAQSSASAGTERQMHGPTVRELLDLAVMSGVTVAAGAGGLDREVLGANVMEVPDILPWVKPHELLLTTGYPLRDDAQRLVGLTADLADVGLSALAIKLHRYLDDLPPAMLAEAEARDLPVLLLPDGIGFDDVLTSVLTAILNRQAAVLHRSEAAHKALIAVVLEGGGLGEVAQQVAAMLGGPTFVTTFDGRVLAQAGDREALAAVLGSPCFEPGGRFRTEQTHPGVHEVARLPGSHAVVPVVAGRVDHGRLVTFNLCRLLGSGDVQVLERAATVAALAVTKSLAVAAVEAKYRGDFLRDVLDGRAGGPDRVRSHFASLGWDVTRPMVVLVAALEAAERAEEPTESALRPTQEHFTSAWETVVGRLDPRAPVVGFAQEVVALLGVPDTNDAGTVVQRMVREVTGDSAERRRPFATGVSRIVTGVDGLPDAYEQASRAVHVGRQLHGSSAIAHFDELGVFRLLSLIDDPAELQGFVDEVLGPLGDLHDPGACDLRRTLATLLDTNLNVAQAARQLHFHYNTLRYRIVKLERIVGPFTSDPHLRLDLSLALRVLQLRTR